jgi:hypothetical protein
MSEFAICDLLFAIFLPPLAVDFLGEFEEELLVVVERASFVGPDVDDQVVAAAIVAGEVVLGEAKGFAEEAFDAVSLDSAADFSADAEAEACVGEGVGSAVDGQGARGAADAGAIDGLELPGVGEAVAAAEVEGGGGQCLSVGMGRLVLEFWGGWKGLAHGYSRPCFAYL